ncbi:MAG: choice-of-anchor D domain-containing protein, partial [Actinomycetota bacterium]|nr:choice-of-anchor D domain-containing protein [Actinomycetota bacterium]
AEPAEPAPAEAAVTLSSTSIAFGDQGVGTSSGSRPVTVTNTGELSLTVGAISVSGDFTASGTCVAGTSVAPGESCTIDVTFSPTAGGFRSGTLTIHHDAPDGPHVVELTGTGVIKADLGISMGASPNPVRTGTDLTYSITVSNVGPSAAADVTVTDALPANTQFTSVSPSSGWVCTTPPVGSSGTVRCQLPTLAKASQATIQLVVKVVASGGSTVTNTATVSSPWTDPDTSDNSATVATSTFGRR